MLQKKIVVLMISFALLPMLFSCKASESTPPAIEGIHTVLEGEKFKFDGKTVEVIEFMSFYCHTCYEFERAIPVIKGNFPKKIIWKIIPIYWGEHGSPKPGEAYLLAEEAGKGEQMKKALFRAQMIEQKNIADINVLESIGSEIGLDHDFGRRLKAGDKAQEAQKNLDMAKIYKVDETPTLIIAGNIMTNPHAVDHNIDSFKNNVITILKSILTQNK